MSVKVSITNAEIDVLYDLLDGDSIGSPEHPLYEVLKGFISKVARADNRPATDPQAAQALADTDWA